MKFPVEFPLSSEKSMYDVLGDDLYPFMLVQLGSAYGYLIVSTQSNSACNET